MSYQDITVTSVSEFVKYISEKNALNRDAGGKSSSLLFRGQSNCNNILLPAIGRHSNDSHGEQFMEPFLREERNMIEMAKYKLPDVFNNTLQPIDLLALLQHHGIPTRLLDISENALVALYFACATESELGMDGEVLIFNHQNENIENFPMINAIADSYRFIRGERTSLKFFYEQISRQPYYTEQAYMYEDLDIDDDGAKWVHECCNEIMIIYAKSYGLRQRIQRGRYILFPNTITTGPDGTEYFEQNITPIDKKHRSIIGRVLIPSECKKNMLEDLHILGISRDMLFLDNVDIICKEISERVKLECL